jgi:hypothetical protein
MPGDTTADAGPAADPRLLAAAIHRQRGALWFTSEAQLQTALADLLAAEGYQAAGQVRLGPGERLDFLVGGGIAVELKVAGPPDALERQITRYAAHDQVTAIVIVTTRARHQGMPEQVGGKPVFVVYLGGAF